MLCAALCLHGLVRAFSSIKAHTVLLILEIRFPFLFYSTTYMGQVMAKELGKEPNHEYAIRRGELALLIYSIGWRLHLCHRSYH
jgi:hypothetical protein